MPTDRVVGWDLGGAHVKAALVDGDKLREVVQVPCRLWQGLGELDHAVAEVLAKFGSVTRHGITMTGEMTDLFESRAAGVAALVTAMEAMLPGAELLFYAADDGMIGADAARIAPLDVASANWHATAAWTARRIGEGLLLDIGSTTTDIVPLRGGAARTKGRNDAERLVSGELVYTGVVRTPLMAMAERAPFGAEWVPLIAEHFATSADVYRLTGQLPESRDQHPASDGGAKTPEASARRLARMIGRDLADADLDAWRELARWFAERQTGRIAEACVRVLARESIAPDAPVISAGAGRFLAPEIARHLGRPCVDFGHLTGGGEWAAVCAPAVAVALLCSAVHD
jgi:(4-(4-[2-(gamma-L-glutamylamino)ethyl]phenoxymethyl)furan-2-yl)methanamine synthase